jgi:hypothetical protein
MPDVAVVNSSVHDVPSMVRVDVMLEVQQDA